MKVRSDRAGGMWLACGLLGIALVISCADGQTATAPAAQTQPAAKKRERNFNGPDAQPPMIRATHVSDEILARLCADLYLDGTATAHAKSVHDTYISGLRTLADEQDERMYQWQLKAEEEIVGQEIILQPGQTAADLTPEQRQKWANELQYKQMGLNRAYGNREFVLRLNEMNLALGREAMDRERALRQTFLTSLQESLPASSQPHWERAMLMLRINLQVVHAKHPRAMFSDPARIDFHQIVRDAAADEGELHGLVNLPGLIGESTSSATTEAIGKLDRLITDYEVGMAASLDVNAFQEREIRYQASKAFNEGDLEKAEDLGRQVRARARTRYNLQLQAAQQIGELLRSTRGDDAANRWTERFNSMLYPALFTRDSVDEMHKWIEESNLPLGDEQRAAVTAIIQQYRIERDQLRQRIMPLIIEAACDPAMFPSNDPKSARAIRDEAYQERTPLAEKTHKALRAMFDSQWQAKYDAQRVVVQAALLNSHAQPAPP
jgi:hypothetical protein